MYIRLGFIKLFEEICGIIKKYKKEIVINKQKIKNIIIINQVIGIIWGIKEHYFNLIILNWQFNVI